MKKLTIALLSLILGYNIASCATRTVDIPFDLPIIVQPGDSLIAIYRSIDPAPPGYIKCFIQPIQTPVRMFWVWGYPFNITQNGQSLPGGQWAFYNSNPIYYGIENPAVIPNRWGYGQIDFTVDQKGVPVSFVCHLQLK